MSTAQIECLGCHRLNPSGTVFCLYCRRKIRLVESPAAPVTTAPEPTPAKRGWWHKLTGAK